MIVYVTGRPGSGKSSLCRQLAFEYNGTHVSIGDMLRKELEGKSELASLITASIGVETLASTESFLPSSLIIALLAKYRGKIKSPIFLDGYPVNEENYRRGCPLPGEKVIGVINLVVSDRVAVLRCIERQRENETEAVIKKRLKMFAEHTRPVIVRLLSDFEVCYINTEKDRATVFQIAKEKYQFLVDNFNL